jgi:hypothetical protein
MNTEIFVVIAVGVVLVGAAGWLSFLNGGGTPAFALEKTVFAQGEPVRYEVRAEGSEVFLRDVAVLAKQGGSFSELLLWNPDVTGVRIDNLDPGYALRKLAANAKWSGEWDGKAFRKDARGRYEAFAPTGTFKLSVQYSTKAKMMIGDAYGSLEPPVQTLESPEFTISPR